jgi:MipA family protein
VRLKLSTIALATAVASVFTHSTALAANETTPPAQPLWELGVFGVGISQQAYPGSDQTVNRGLLLPYAVYRGEYFRADRNTAGIRAIKTPTIEVDVGFAGSFGSSSDDVDARRGMPDLGTLIEFGPRLKWNIGPGPGGGRWRADLPIRGVFDMSDGARHRGVAFEPELTFERRASNGWAYNTSIGAIIGDTKLNRTFYEVAPRFATPERRAYTAKSGLIGYRLGLSLTKSLTPDWRMFAFARVDSVNGAANDASPLIKQNTGASVGIGLAYTWRRSQSRAAD